MIDRYLIPPLHRLLNKPGQWIAARSITANQVTLIGFIIGMLALPLLAVGAFELALIAILFNRIADGLDGAVARCTEATDAGGFLDIVLDFIFYQAVVVGFILNSPHEHLLPGLFLMLSFVGTGTSFLAFAVQASKRGGGTTRIIRTSRCITWADLPKVLKPSQFLLCCVYCRSTLALSLGCLAGCVG